MTLSKLLFASYAAYAAAGSGANLEFTSTNLYGGGDRGIESVKGVINSEMSLPGLGDVGIELEYDTNPVGDSLGGITDVTLTGSVDKINYELSRSDDATELTLTSNVEDVGEITVDVDVRAGDVTSVSLERELEVGDLTVTATPSLAPGSGKSKLKLSTVLGSGIEATATIDDLTDGRDTSLELSYEKDLGDGRTLTATVDAKEATGEVEIVDTETLDFTTTLKFKSNGDPELTLKRSFSFF